MLSLLALIASGSATSKSTEFRLAVPGADLTGKSGKKERRMYVGTQIEPRDDADYRVWAQLGVTHVCVDPPGHPHHWSLDDLCRHKEHVESFGLSLDMVQLPISSGPIEAQERPHVLLAKDPERQPEIE